MRYDLGVSVKERTRSLETREGVLIFDSGDIIFAPATPCGISSEDPDFTDRAKQMIARRECREKMLETERDQLIAIDGAYSVGKEKVEQIKLKRLDRGIVRPGAHPGLILKTATEKYRYDLIEKRDLPVLSDRLQACYGERFKE